MINSVRCDYMLARCRTILHRSVPQARRRGMLRGAVYVSIDMHDIPFYAKCMRLIYAVKSRSKSGTGTFNRLATIHYVTAGHRLTLGVEVVRRHDETADVVGRLLDGCTKKGINIAPLTMDRGFYSVSVINAVTKRGVPAVMPTVKTRRVKKEIRSHDSGEKGAVIAHEISSGKDSASYTLISLKRKEKASPIDDEELRVLDELYSNNDNDAKDEISKEYYVFATTMDGEWMREDGDPYTIAKFYKRRWGIENSYKCHEEIRPRTTSTKYSVRILWRCLPFILYNA